MVAWRLYIVRFLHQTTTGHAISLVLSSCISSVSYIKPQQGYSATYTCVGCISSVSYIKPQLVGGAVGSLIGCISSVSYIKPQHAHGELTLGGVVYRPFPTSNHNFLCWRFFLDCVVYRPFPTSNHNKAGQRPLLFSVVYRPFPTSNHNKDTLQLIRALLYIVRFLHQTTTVLSCRHRHKCCISSVSYIKPQLMSSVKESALCCISSVSYIKPQQNSSRPC